MPLFFFLSGFLLFYNRGEKVEWNRKEWLWKKVKTLIIPYLVWSFAALLLKIVMNLYLNNKTFFSLYAILRLLFSPRDGALGYFWFICTLMQFYGIGLLLLKVSNEKKRWIIYTIALVATLYPLKVGWLGVEDFCENFIFFVLGFCCGKIRNKNIIRILNVKVGILIQIAAWVLYYLQEYYGEKRVFDVFIAILMIYVTICFSYGLRKKKYKWVEWINGNMLSLYICAWPFQATMEVITYRILKLPWYIIFGSVCIAGWLGTALLLKMNKYIQRKTKTENIKEKLNVVLGVR